MSDYTYIKNAIKRKHRNIKRFENFKRWFKLFPVFYSLLLISGTIIIISGIVWLFANLEWFELKSKNDLGDAFGGLTNPIVAFIGVIVTFLAFYIQYTFNKEQSKLIAIQRKERIEDKKERDIEVRKQYFDNKFYELLKMHLNNIKEFNIDNKFYGRKSIVKMYEELIVILTIYNHFFNKIDRREFNYTSEAYSVFFHGKDLVYNNEKYKPTKEVLEKYKSSFKEIALIFSGIESRYEVNTSDTFEFSLTEFYTGILSEDDEKYKFEFYPFDGHTHRLNHYFRHLYNLLKSIDGAKFLDIEEKKDYFNIVRSQLSNYEQCLIYYNAVSWFPEKWSKFIVEYQIIKNLPLELCTEDPKPDDFYSNEIEELKSKGIKMFNWVKLEDEEK